MRAVPFTFPRRSLGSIRQGLSMVRGTGNGEIDSGMQSKSSRQRAKRNSLEVQLEISVEINVAESNLKPGDTKLGLQCKYSGRRKVGKQWLQS